MIKIITVYFIRAIYDLYDNHKYIYLFLNNKTSYEEKNGNLKYLATEKSTYVHYRFTVEAYRIFYGSKTIIIIFGSNK